MIELDGVEYGYDERPVLRGITASLSERRIGIVGSNGSGKSTLARMLNGLIVPTRGAVRVDGLDTDRDGRAVRRRVGFVFQNPDVQIVYPTVAEDLAFGLKPFRLPKAEVAARVDAVLARYGLERYRNHPAHLLSGGEKQLLAIAAVLVTDPAHVVFDEPTTLLDRRNRRHVRSVIDGLAQSAIVITHDLDLLDGFDRVLVVEEGRIVADDTPAAAIAAYIARIG
ncbi:biotin transport system ATP-binding protein [Azospirillum fermentarium]|uniref:energy-coupling factor ABC transporter ATP-binding protein n=1 Tax=Azospirillum fermentarium TaxID=1233114 RepID=UPI002227459A|nr:ABC transporter ATP-binding protein [Azospirillum fermentarium]MCW2245521.1 biotin transport system ATP-binding protein [Azospirillum fermentarium]